MSMFDEAMKEAEAALKRHRKPAPTPNKVNGVGGTDVGELVTRDYMEAALDKLRADMNDVLDSLENEPVAPKVLQLQDRVGDLIGEIEGARHHAFETLVKAAHVRDRHGCRKNIALVGPTGSGKSTAGEQLAELTGLPFNYIGQTELPTDVVGYVHPVNGTYMSTPFVDAYVNGGIVMLEEMDAWSPRATLVTNVPLANGYITLPDGSKHKRHPDCVIIACMNTWGSGATADYVGRNKLDAAYMNRFGIKLLWDYDEVLEAKAAGNDDVVRLVQTARYNARQAGLKVIVSPRVSIDMADMVACGFTMREACDMTFLQGLDKGQRKRLMEDCIV